MPCQGTSNEYPQHIFSTRSKKNFTGYFLLSRAKHIEYFASFSSVSVRHDKCKYIPRKLYKGREQVCKKVSVFCPLICKFSMFLFGDRFSLVNTVHVKYKCPKILYTKVSGKMAYSNSADLDQTALSRTVWLGSTLYHYTKYFNKQLHIKQSKNYAKKKNGIKC